MDEDVSSEERRLRAVGVVCIGYANDLYSPGRGRGSSWLAPTIDSLSENEQRVGLEALPGGWWSTVQETVEARHVCHCWRVTCHNSPSYDVTDRFLAP